MVLCLYNIPQYILSLMQLIIEVESEPAVTTQMFHEGLNLIRKLCIENYAGSNQMFTGYNFVHIEKLYDLRVNEMNLVSKQMALDNDTRYLIEGNNNILYLHINIYSVYLQKVVDQIYERGLENNFSNMSSEFILIIYNFNDIFSTLLEASVNKRSTYEFYLADILINVTQVALNILAEETISDENDRLYQFWTMIQQEPNGYVKHVADWDILENDFKRIMILELMRSCLEVFNRATTRFYTFSNLDVIANYLTSVKPIQVFFKYFYCEVGISVMSQIVKLYNNFMVFRQNHLINNRFEEFGDLETQTTEMTLSPYLLEKEVISELLGLNEHSEAYLKKFGMGPETAKFFFCSYFPLLFKYFSGLMTTFIYADHKYMRKGFENVFETLTQFTRFINTVDTYLRNNHLLHPLTDRMPHKYKNVDRVDVYLNKFVGLLQKTNTEYFYDENKKSNIYICRQKGYRFLKTLLDLYTHHKRKKMHLERYIRYDPNYSHSKMKKIMSKKLRFNYLYRQSNNLSKEENFNTIIDFDVSEPKEIIQIINQLYYAAKTYFFENPNKNQCFKVLKTSDVLNNNVLYYICYFFTELNTMDLSFENLANNVFINQKFISLILMMDNLINISADYRITLYNFIATNIHNELSYSVKENVMKKLWDLHKLLYYLTLYKTFYDEVWAEIYTLYFLISNFFQDLCEDNFIPFKLWFHKNKMIEDDGKSIFLSYFSMFEAAFHNTKVHKNKTPTLMLSDKPELFDILNRLTVGMTEFINGGAVKTQFEIYRYKIDVWVGIILRIIDDVDSKFYILKENILTFILGLTEGCDKNIINFLATHFPITRLYDLIYRLTKKLFVRQAMLKKGVQKEHEPSILGYYCYRITESEENLYPIKKSSQLLDFYRKYDISFSDHIILAIVIKTYTLMRDLSTCVVKYENFLIEKREDIMIYSKKEKFITSDFESLHVWHFISKIIIDIEISYQDANSESEELPLRIIYFKKLPQSFFLTNIAKNEFRNRVNIKSLEEKHEQFFNEFNRYYTMTNDLRKLYIKSKTLFKLSTEEAFYFYMILLYVMGLSLNLMLLLCYDEIGDDFSSSRCSTNGARYALSIIIILLSVIFGAFWFVVKYNTIRKINWEKYYITHTRGQKINPWDIFVIDVYESIICNSVIQSFILYFILSLLGIAANPFFYTMLLLLIVHLSMTVYNVALSFMNNYDKLFFTLLMIVIVINSFSYLAIQFYREDFESDIIRKERDASVCSNYFSCFMNGINLGLRGNGGLSDFLRFEPNNKRDRYAGRLIFDIVYFIIVSLILLGIFFGIIVDSFKALRDEMNKRKKDADDVCFTCGLERPVLERKGIDFDNHLKYHDIWNYFFYLQYLKWKPKNAYSGVDIFVSDLIQRDYNNIWLPIGRTMELEKTS